MQSITLSCRFIACAFQDIYKWQVMASYLRPHLEPELLSAEAVVDADAETMLTVHLRGDDVRAKLLYHLNQPPCSLAMT